MTNRHASPVFRRRSLLFMPGDDLRKIAKATTLPLDSVIMDLEDATAPARKLAARTTTAEALATLDFGGRERLVRINPINGAFGQADLTATLPWRPDGYVVPKVEKALHLTLVSKILDAVEAAHGWPPGAIRLLGMIETARGVLNLREIAEATTRLDGLILGAEDLAADMGATRTADGWEIFYARSALVTTAAAVGVQALDSIFVDLDTSPITLERLASECRFVARLGYTGKTLIHPRHLEIANRVFTPSAEEIAGAQRLLSVFEAHQTAGAGAFELDGKMVDKPMLRAAQRLLARAGVS
ncbi:MAG: CoA ester lyase [Chloroflexota bacterium]|nr:CoA ester lyase [Chloroflexota bacterium]